MEKYKLLKGLPNAKAGGDIRAKRKRQSAGWFKKMEEKKYGGRVPKKGDIFYCISAAGAVIEGEWLDGGVCESKFECNNGFWTEEEAKKELARRKAYVILKEDTKGFKSDWERNSLGEYKGHSYGVYYCRPSRKLLVNQCGTHEVQDGIRFATKEDAEASIEAHKKEWLDYLGGEEWLTRL